MEEAAAAHFRPGAVVVVARFDQAWAGLGFAGAGLGFGMGFGTLLSWMEGGSWAAAASWVAAREPAL